MGLSKLISLSVTLAFLAVGTGNLPWVLKQVRKVQFELIQESKASKWPKAMKLKTTMHIDNAKRIAIIY